MLKYFGLIISIGILLINLFYFDFNEWNKLDGNGLIKEFTRPKDLQDSKE